MIMNTLKIYYFVVGSGYTNSIDLHALYDQQNTASISMKDKVNLKPMELEKFRKMSRLINKKATSTISISVTVKNPATVKAIRKLLYSYNYTTNKLLRLEYSEIYSTVTTYPFCDINATNSGRDGVDTTYTTGYLVECNSERVNDLFYTMNLKFLVSESE